MKTIAMVIICVVFCCSCSNMDKSQSGAALGALSGGLIGSMTGHGKIKPALIGAGIGLGIGYILGNEMDKYDKTRVAEVLELSPSNRKVAWTNPDTNKTFSATPKRAEERQGRIYREVEIESYVNGRKELIKANAYRDGESGRWYLEK